MKRTVNDADVQALWDELSPVITAEFNASGELNHSMIGIHLGAGVGEIRTSHKVPEDIVKLLFMGPRLASLRRNFMRSLITPPPEVSDLGVDVVVMVSEAWSVNRPLGAMPPEEVERITREGVSEQPDRQEAICIIFHTAGRENCGFCPIDPTTRKAGAGHLVPSDEVQK